MMTIATNKINCKRQWSNMATKAFDEGIDNKCVMYFCIGLIESGFQKDGEYAGVVRWHLKGTTIEVLVNTNNASWGFDNKFPYLIKESFDFFDTIRKVWLRKPKDS